MKSLGKSNIVKYSQIHWNLTKIGISWYITGICGICKDHPPFHSIENAGNGGGHGAGCFGSLRLGGTQAHGPESPGPVRPVGFAYWNGTHLVGDPFSKGSLWNKWFNKCEYFWSRPVLDMVQLERSCSAPSVAWLSHMWAFGPHLQPGAWLLGWYTKNYIYISLSNNCN